MGRRKVPMKKIEDKPSRQVTFSKRRSGLMKKAGELSILCDVDVAVIIISANGKVYDLCTGNCLRKILDRYQIHVEANDNTPRAHVEANRYRAVQRASWTSADLQQIVKNIFEEQNMNQLNIVELMQLEQQVDITLGQTRFRKAQLMMETINALQEREKQLRQEKQFMEREIEAKFHKDSHHVHEKDLVKELELNNDNHAGDGSNEKPPQQVMFRLF